MQAVDIGWPLAVLLSVFAGIAALVTHVAGLGRPQDALVAAGRAVVQLLVVSVVIVGALRSVWLTLAFVLLMTVVATGTAARRVTGHHGRGSAAFALPIVASVAPALGLVLASQVVPLEPIAVLPVAGILLGGAMTVTVLSGRRLVDELTSQRGAYEAALSVGLTRRQAVTLVARSSAGLALLPGLDQTRTVGLVTLPGAFVGVLLAGESPIHAGAAQVLVLVALLAVQAVAAALVVELVSRGWVPIGQQPLPV